MHALAVFARIVEYAVALDGCDTDSAAELTIKMEEKIGKVFLLSPLRGLTPSIGLAFQQPKRDLSLLETGLAEVGSGLRDWARCSSGLCQTGQTHHLVVVRHSQVPV